ncbi:MAG: hypothetical protein A3G75_13295 [Verrucomicrobia bacterium RIFCSPLOWO2_12_FULL_64_8]|nr:MAG: hypothetical protein A3G75_13295 [Verrucomicrobia bacterium RIFCSPLOWO2_12_FULL_64_8]
MENGKALKEAYPGKDPKSYGCKACHQNAVGKKGDLNAYGQALQASKGEGNAKKLTVEDLRAVEAQDSDKDGASNGQEWQAGTNPSDPASKP